MTSTAMMWAMALVSGYLLYRIFSKRQEKTIVHDYDREINAVLNDDKYKVKGRFE